jgi:cell division protein FtsW
MEANMRSERLNINILNPLQMLDVKAGQKTFIDMSILIPVLFLISIGIVMIASASLSVSEFKYSDRLFFLKRHLFYVSLSLICLYIAFRIPTNVWGKYSSYLIMACLFLLGLVLIPGIGIERNGSQRWLNIFGFTFQVSEWVKLSFIIFLAHYINLNKKSFFLKHQPIIKISVLFLVVSALLIAEPDFGSFVLIGFTLVSMLFIAGIKLRYFISILALVTVSFWILAEISPYRLSRITSYLDPWSEQFSSGR